MKNKKPSKISYFQGINSVIFLSVGFLGVLVLICLIWLYSGNFTTAKKNVVVMANLPVAVINGRVIFSQSVNQLAEFLKNREDLKNNSNEAAIFKQALLIAEESEQVIALANKFVPSQNFSDYEEYVKFYQNDLEIKSHEYKVSKANLIRWVIEPEYYKNKLITWYNGKEEVNRDVFEAMKNLQRRLLLGESFQSLASEYDENDSSVKFEGDAGFLKENEIDPEIRKEVIQIPPGQNRIIANRDGLLLVYMMARTGKVGDADTLYHIGEILMKETGFDIWFKDSLSKQKVLNFF